MTSQNLVIHSKSARKPGRHCARSSVQINKVVFVIKVLEIILKIPFKVNLIIFAQIEYVR